MNMKLDQAQINAIIAKMKEEFKLNANKVETVEVNQFLQQFGEIGALCNTLGIKLRDSLGEVHIFTSLVSALRMHGHKTFEMHFPDGSKYEVVMRYREGDTHARSFCYEL